MKRFEVSALCLLASYAFSAVLIGASALTEFQIKSLAFAPGVIFFLGAILSLQSKSPEVFFEGKRLLDRAVLFGLSAIGVRALMMIMMYDVAAIRIAWLTAGSALALVLAAVSAGYAVRALIYGGQTPTQSPGQSLD